MTNKGAIVGVVRRLLRPIVRLMIALDFNARDFLEVVKMVYTEIALQENGKQARVTSASAAARMTGLTRREVTRLRGVLEKVPTDTESCVVPPERILMAWCRSPECLDADADADADADDVSVSSPRHLLCEMHLQSLERFARVMADLGTTMSNNLISGSPEGILVEGCSVTERAVTVSVDEVRSYMDRRALEFLEEMEGWLNDRIEYEGTSSPRLGIGVYAIQDPGCIPEPRQAVSR